MAEGKDSAVVNDFLRVFIVPVLINKGVMLYFGLEFANHPGEGYGYGLLATILFLLFTVSRFLWKYRKVQDP